MPVPSRPRVVVVGAGFGGLWAARALSRSPADVLLIDRNNYHTFLPLLYQVAAAELEPGDIVYPVRSILRGLPNADFALAEVRRINFSERLVYGRQGRGLRLPDHRRGKRLALLWSRRRAGVCLPSEDA